MELSDYESDPAADRARRSAELTEQLEELTRAQRTGDQLARSRAASRLVTLQADPELLVDALGHPRAAVREAAAETIGHGTAPLSPLVTDMLLAAIDDPSPFVVAAAIRTLGRRAVGPARDQIAACLDDQQPPVVAAAIVALARLGDTALAATLPALLASDQLAVRIAAAEAAGLLRAPAAVPGLLRLLEECIAAWVDAPVSIPARTAGVAMLAISRLRARAAVPLLIEIARSVIGLRTLAVRTLNELRAVEAAPAIAPLLADEGVGLTREAARLIHRADYRPALPAIRALLGRHAPSLRVAALQTLGAWGDAAIRPIASDLATGDPNADVRRAARSCLAALDGQPAAAGGAEPQPAAPIAIEQLLPPDRLARLLLRRRRIAELRVGDQVSGPIVRALPYGALVDLAGAEGMVHISEISWQRISDARQAVAAGQLVEALVIGLDAERGHVTLSMRRLTPDPWADAAARYAVGDAVSGHVVDIAPFGVFVELRPGLQALLHSSGIPPAADALRERFPVGASISATVARIEPERRRMALTLLAAPDLPEG